MAYPIKYIENNLVFNHDGECFAYYELLPYNYSFLSPEQKYQVHDSFRQLIAQNRDGKIHALQISTESSIRAAQERSKQEVTGKLKDIACAKIDAQTEALISMIGENQVDYRFFIGFKLLVNEQEVTMKQFRREAKTAVSDFLHEVNLILSRLVDTFFSRISLTMPPAPKSHNTAYVLPWEEPLHWQSRSSGYSSS